MRLRVRVWITRGYYHSKSASTSVRVTTFRIDIQAMFKTRINIILISATVIIFVSTLREALGEQCSCCAATPVPLNYITSPCDLDCDFDRPCRWRNGTNGIEDDFDWPISTSVIFDHWHSIPRGRDGPCDPFAYTRGAFGMKHADNRAILVSDPIRCQVGDGMLKFWYWKTALYPSLRVCIRKVPGPCGILTCIATIHGLHRQEWIMKTVTIPQQTEPFEIVFEARFKHNFDIIGLDKISYSARLCEPAQPLSSVTFTSKPGPAITEPLPITSNTFETQTPARYSPAPVIVPPPSLPNYAAPPAPAPVPGTGPYAPPGQRPQSDNVVGPCPAVDCAFDRGSSCSYSSSTSGYPLPPGAALRQWKVTNTETSNSLTGIFSDLTGTGMYAFAGETTNNLDTFVLESPRFQVSSPSLVEFSYYLAGIQGRLRGCVNGLTDCRFESMGKDIKSDARRWRRGSFQLDPGAYTIGFVGDNLGKNYVIGLDNVELKNPTGTLLPCA